MLKPPIFVLLLLATLAGGQTASSVPPVKRALPVEETPAPPTPAPPSVKRALPLDQPPAAPAKPPVIPATPPAPAVLKPAPSAPAKPPAPPEIQPIRGALPLEGEADLPIKPEAPKVAENVKPQGEDAVRLQIFLDEAKFGPGVIDGKPGRFTELAVRSWNEVNGHPLDDWSAVMTAARKAVPSPLAVALVPDWSKDWVNPDVPFTDRKGQSKLKRMSYRSVAELMSERYHTDVPYLTELNGDKKINNLKARDSVIVPNVKAFRFEDIKGTNYPADEALSQRHVVVDTKINQMRIFEATPAALVVEEPTATASAAGPAPEVAKPAPPAKGPANRGLIASFPITPGKPKFIKLGTWEIRNCVELPVWRYDKQLLETGKRGDDSDSLVIPPGPNSPVGVIWNGTSRPGIGLHGTSDPETIGRARSAGCIRLANWDAIRLPTLIRPGATVEIR
ncbi:MAG: L,D-transpeptidase [Verrucomicrobia bacterium]|nr:L,D-transpeptidase [Verrucomicrobiota bacterium]